MRRPALPLILLCILPVFVAASAPDPEEDAPIRILLTHGGHWFQEAEFFAMFDALEGVEYTRASLPEMADLLRPGLQQEYDVIVMYDMVAEFTPQQQQAFVALLMEGIGLVSLHHNIGAHRDWEEFAQIIGGRFFFSEGVIHGETHAPSSYSQGERVQVTVADPDHPITRGVSDFEISDETFAGCYIAPDSHILLKTDHPRSDPHLAWTRSYGQSRVFYLMLGHDNQAWQHPAYPRLLDQGIRWAAGREPGTQRRGAGRTGFSAYRREGSAPPPDSRMSRGE
jgi:uncharacterized protein